MKSRIIIVDSISSVNKRLEPQIGPLIIRDILREKYEVDIVSFTNLENQHKLKIHRKIDDNISDFTDYIISLKPSVVSFYTICDSFYISARLSESIKKKNPNIKIVMGGPHATLIAAEILSDFPWVDIISMGEGEKTVLSIMDALINNGNFSSLYNVAYRVKDDIIIRPFAPLISDDELAKYVPDDFENYDISNYKGMSMEGGRGCPFNCTFCSTSSFWGRSYRVKKTEAIIDEMRNYHKKFGFTYFAIQHDLFTANKNKIMEFCRELTKEKVKYYWGCSSRVDVLDYEMIDAMVKANCKDIFLGIETGSVTMQKKLNKNLNLERAYTMIRYMKEKGIELSLSFIYCYPDETIEDFQCTAKLIESLILLGVQELSLHVFMLLPKTIETDKVYDRAFFNEDYLETSIYSPSSYTKESIEFIKTYKREFIQFYTFESEVRRKYQHFNLWVEMLMYCKKVYSTSITRLLEKFGILNIYEEQNENIYNAYIKYRDLFGYYENHEKQNVYYECIKNILEYYKLQIFTDDDIQVYYLESIIHQHITGEIQMPKVYHFTIDVLMIKNNNKLVKQDTYVRVWKTGKNSVKVSKVELKKEDN